MFFIGNMYVPRSFYLFFYLFIYLFFVDEQRLTNSALDYSSQLSPLDQRIVKQFDKGNP